MYLTNQRTMIATIFFSSRSDPQNNNSVRLAFERFNMYNVYTLYIYIYTLCIRVILYTYTHTLKGILAFDPGVFTETKSDVNDPIFFFDIIPTTPPPPPVAVNKAFDMVVLFAVHITIYIDDGDTGKVNIIIWAKVH